MYIKACLNTNFIEDIILPIIKFLYSTNIGFIDQLSPEAGLGCHPYHITMIGGITYEYSNYIESFIKIWYRDVDYVSIMPSNQIKITNRGRVLLMIHSATLNEMSNHMITKIMEDNVINKPLNIYHKLHVTLGITTNKNLYGKQFTIYDMPEKEYGIGDFGWDY